MDKITLKKFEASKDCSLTNLDLELVKRSIESQIENLNSFEHQSIINERRHILHGMELISISLGISIDICYGNKRKEKPTDYRQ